MAQAGISDGAEGVALADRRGDDDRLGARDRAELSLASAKPRSALLSTPSRSGTAAPISPASANRARGPARFELELDLAQGRLGTAAGDNALVEHDLDLGALVADQPGGPLEARPARRHQLPALRQAASRPASRRARRDRAPARRPPCPIPGARTGRRRRRACASPSARGGRRRGARAATARRGAAPRPRCRNKPIHSRRSGPGAPPAKGRRRVRGASSGARSNLSSTSSDMASPPGARRPARKLHAQCYGFSQHLCQRGALAQWLAPRHSSESRSDGCSLLFATASGRRFPGRRADRGSGRRCCRARVGGR